jgi:hypothetical protein
MSKTVALGVQIDTKGSEESVVVLQINTKECENFSDCIANSHKDMDADMLRHICLPYL